MKRSGRGKISATTKAVTGVLQMHPSGRGFVDIGEAYEDVVVASKDVGVALDGDTVVVEVWEGLTRMRGRIVEVVSRGRVRLTGVLMAGSPPTIRPDDPRILSRIVVTDQGPARPGQVVLGQITGYPEAPRSPIQVRIFRVLGEPGMLLTEVAKCLGGREIDEAFPEQVALQIHDLPGWVRPRDKTDRLDLRDRHFVTIDPLRARDFDDAIAVEEGPDGTTRVWVAVADVSHYVPEGSTVDWEARRRGCSVYLPDRAIHMLPESLSSGICSLVPRRDRLAMVVRLDISDRGRVVQDSCAAAVVHSRGRLDYSGVAAALKGDFTGLRVSYREHSGLLASLHHVASALRARRLRRGSLDLDLPEPQVVLDEDDPNRVRQVVQSRPDTPIKRAYSLVEELMIAANEAVGRHFQRADRDTIWRIHPTPRREALTRLCVWMKSYGIDADEEDLLTGRGMGRLLARIKDHRAARPLSYLVLRTLKQATYSASNVGHFGLASRAYLHFTSPIRRYPDLHVHRLLKALLREQGLPAGRPAQPTVRLASPAQLAEVARESTAAERRAVEVEREVHRVYACSLMRDRIDEEGWGTITGINSFGFFVTLDDPFVEGLVKAEDLPDEPSFDAERLRLFGPGRRPRVYSLGDRTLVQVVDTSVVRRQIDLALTPGPDTHLPDPDPGSSGRPTREGRDRGKQQYQRRGGGRTARTAGSKSRGRRKSKRGRR